MSSLIVEVCKAEWVDKHPNADRMCIVAVKGWRVCAGRDPETGKNQFEPGDKCVYIPPDAVLPQGLSDRLGVTKYLSKGRVRVARLRGEASYGLIMKPDDTGLEVGTDVAAYYGITKWEPPEVRVDGDAEAPHPAFHKYTDIENYRNFPDLFTEGEEVVLTEKLHGMNCRLGLVRDGDEWAFMAGSHGQRRKPIDAKGRTPTFWAVMTDQVKGLLQHVRSRATHGVILFGEIFGSGVQDMCYGLQNGKVAFRAFDLAVDGAYLGFDEKEALCRQFGVDTTPVLYRGPFSREVVEQHVSGPTTVCPPEAAGPFKGREGVVVTPTRERLAEWAGEINKRVILKAISFEYLERRGGTEQH